MDKFRTAMGLLTGIILGIANGIGFKSMTVGFTALTCFSILFIYIFNKHDRAKK